MPYREAKLKSKALRFRAGAASCHARVLHISCMASDHNWILHCSCGGWYPDYHRSRCQVVASMRIIRENNVNDSMIQNQGR